jgi:glucosamine--fructose-6-phosphate aminotransferase (isomerizing)
MCGIVGYVGPRTAAPLVLDALHRLEYRGYDSSGVATVAGTTLAVEKAAGRIAVLEQRLGKRVPAGGTGIAHTRWATHGAPNDANAHPHTDCGGAIALVHNGIIENAGPLRERLTARGHVFRSETDTEVVAHLIEDLYAGSLVDAVMAALPMLEGTYGLAIVSAHQPERSSRPGWAPRCSSASATTSTSSPPTRRRSWTTPAPWSTSTTGKWP